MEIVELTTREQLDKLYTEWALTFEGCTIDNDNLQFLAEWIRTLQADKKPLDSIYLIKGKTMNEVYGLTNNNKYPDDLNIVAVDNEYVDTNKIAIQRFALGGRWFTDIVDNNARREDKKMYKIEFEYQDKYTIGEWHQQMCVMSSVQECINWYGLGKDCEYRILSVEEIQ